jgi:hypothetical protein
MLPEHPTDFWIRRWFFGVGVSFSLIICGVSSLILQHSYAIGKIGRWGYGKWVVVEVYGFQAVLMGLAYLGLGVALFSYAYAPYSEKFAAMENYGMAGGLFVATIGVCGCTWIFLAG